jgi:hypothetical protein
MRGKIQPTDISIMQENAIACGKSKFLILLEYKEISLTGNSITLVKPKLQPNLGYGKIPLGEIPNYSCCSTGEETKYKQFCVLSDLVANMVSYYERIT